MNVLGALASSLDKAGEADRVAQALIGNKKHDLIGLAAPFLLRKLQELMQTPLEPQLEQLKTALILAIEQQREG